MPFESQLHSFRYAVLPLLRLHQRHKMHLSLSLSSQSFSLGTVVVFMRYNDTSINRQVFPEALLAVLRERSVREALVAALMMYVHIVGYRNVNACASVPLHRQALHMVSCLLIMWSKILRIRSCRSDESIWVTLSWRWRLETFVQCPTYKKRRVALGDYRGKAIA